MLDGPQTKCLIELIQGAFQPPLYDQAVFYVFTIRPASLAPQNASYPDVIYESVLYFDQRGQLKEFFGALTAANPNPDFQAGLTAFAPRAPNPADLPRKLRSLTIGENPWRPFINRSDLRKYLEHLCGPGCAWRVLSLNGTVASGKTYSYNFIREIALTTGYKPVYVDLSAGNFTLLEACEEIATRLRLDWRAIRERFLDDPKPERVALRFWREVRTQAESLTGLCWLVLDGLSDSTIAADISAILVPRLLAEIAMDPLPHLFPILIGDNATRVTQVRYLALHEQVKSYTKTELEGYLTDWCSERNYVLPTQERDTAVAGLLLVTDEADLHSRMQTIADNLIAFLGKLETKLRTQIPTADHAS